MQSMISKADALTQLVSNRRKYRQIAVTLAGLTCRMRWLSARTASPNCSFVAAVTAVSEPQRICHAPDVMAAGQSEAEIRRALPRLRQQLRGRSFPGTQGFGTWQQVGCPAAAGGDPQPAAGPLEEATLRRRRPTLGRRRQIVRAGGPPGALRRHQIGL